VGGRICRGIGQGEHEGIHIGDVKYADN
jgi:hypothetical protein